MERTHHTPFASANRLFTKLAAAMLLASSRMAQDPGRKHVAPGILSADMAVLKALSWRFAEEVLGPSGSIKFSFAGGCSVSWSLPSSEHLDRHAAVVAVEAARLLAARGIPAPISVLGGAALRAGRETI